MKQVMMWKMLRGPDSERKQGLADLTVAMDANKPFLEMVKNSKDPDIQRRALNLYYAHLEPHFKSAGIDTKAVRTQLDGFMSAMGTSDETKMKDILNVFGSDKFSIQQKLQYWDLAAAGLNEKSDVNRSLFEKPRNELIAQTISSGVMPGYGPRGADPAVTIDTSGNVPQGPLATAPDIVAGAGGAAVPNPELYESAMMPSGKSALRLRSDLPENTLASLAAEFDRPLSPAETAYLKTQLPESVRKPLETDYHVTSGGLFGVNKLSGEVTTEKIPDMVPYYAYKGDKRYYVGMRDKNNEDAWVAQLKADYPDLKDFTIRPQLSLESEEKTIADLAKKRTPQAKDTRTADQKNYEYDMQQRRNRGLAEISFDEWQKQKKQKRGFAPVHNPATAPSGRPGGKPVY
jgi:hypothetical protein